MEEREHSFIAGQMQNGPNTLEDSLPSLTKLNILLYNLAIVVLGIYLNELKICPHKSLHMDVYSSFIHNCQNLEATKMPFGRYEHPDNGMIFSAKNK